MNRLTRKGSNARYSGSTDCLSSGRLFATTLGGFTSRHATKTSDASDGRAACQ